MAQPFNVAQIERQCRHTRYARWMGIVGIPLGPVMGIGIVLGLLGFAWSLHVWEKGGNNPNHPAHADLRSNFGWCLAAVILPMLMMIVGGLVYVWRTM